LEEITIIIIIDQQAQSFNGINVFFNFDRKVR